MIAHLLCTRTCFLEKYISADLFSPLPLFVSLPLPLPFALPPSTPRAAVYLHFLTNDFIKHISVALAKRLDAVH